MRVRTLSLAAVALLSALLCAGCSRPVREEGFIRAQDAAGGVYRFDVDLSDSLAAYDLKVYSRVESLFRKLPAMISTPLSVSWISPSGQRYSENVWLTLTRPGTSPYLLESEQFYRRGLVPAEYGKWTLEISPDDAPKGFSGLGVITIRHDGTR